MGVSLLAPLFLAGLAALAVPILVHLTARDRRDVVRFPSLKFLTRLPYRQLRRQKIRHPLLFAMRSLAVTLLVVAFARPLVGGSPAGEGDAETSRDVVIALDRSYSMAYGDAWERAVAAARRAVDALPSHAQVSLLVFAEDARVAVAPTTEAAAVGRALAALAPGSGRTRLAPALNLADEVLLDSSAGGEREVVLVSDFQAHAWDRSRPARLHPGVQLTAVDVSTEDRANVMVAGAEARRGDGDEVLIVARLANRGATPVSELNVRLELDGREVARRRQSLPPSGGAAVALGPIPRPSGVARVAVRIDGDLLEPDDVFYTALSPRPALPLLLIEADDARDDASLYLRQALAVAEDPAFAVVQRRVGKVRPADVASSAVVILADSPFPAGDAGRALADRVAAGAGLWVVLGSRSRPESWPQDAAGLVPGTWRETVDRLDVLGVGLASVDYDHPVFEIFSTVGGVAGARFFRYRPILLDDAAASTALARYTDGAVALAERRHGDGRVLVWGSPLDNRWSDLPLQPAFLPFVHQVCRFLSGERAFDPWREVGEVLDLRELDLEAAGAVIVQSPSGSRREAAMDEEPAITLDEAGFYEVLVEGIETSYPVAVNVDRAESDLARLDVEAFVAASTEAGSASPADGVLGLTREDRERRQSAWWYLVLGALLLLAAESMWSNRLRGSEAQ